MAVRREIELPDGQAAVVELRFSNVTDAGFSWQNVTRVGEQGLSTWELECRRTDG